MSPTTETDPRPLFDAAAGHLSALIAAVPQERLGAPTPCSEYDVRALLGHVVQATDGFATLSETGEKPGDPAPSLSDDGWRDAYETARARVSAAWEDDALLDATMSVPWGEVAGRDALAGAVMETAAHAWDLAQVLGRSCAVFDQEPAEYALDFVHRFLPADRRGAGVPFGPVEEAPEGADAYTRLAAWLGRRTDRAG